MTGKNILLLSLVFLICECNSVSFARDYEFLDLGTLGGRSSGASAINNNGQVVGSSKTSTNTYMHAFIWDIVSGMQDLGTFGYYESSAIDINNSGQVLGQIGSTPFIWSETNGYTQLYMPNPNSRATVYSINNSGRVAGAIDSNAYIWNTPTELEQYPIVQKLVAVNDSGQTIGTYGTTTVNNYTTIDSFFFDSDFDPYDFSTFCNIGSLYPGFINNFTSVTDMNNYGVAVGFSHFTAFIWDSVNGMRDIGTLPGMTCFPQAINNLGQVVGYCNYEVDGHYDSHAFLWDEQNGMQDLGTFGGNSAMACDINDLGQIVGEYRSPSGYFHAFLLTPNSVPEPSLILSYLLGLAWITKNIIRKNK